MNKDNIVDVLNSLVIEQRVDNSYGGLFVLQRNIEPTQISAYKKYSATLWYAQDKKSCKILSIDLTDRVLVGEEEPMVHNLNTKLLFEIFNMYGSEKWHKIVKGDIDGLLEYE